MRVVSFEFRRNKDTDRDPEVVCWQNYGESKSNDSNSEQEYCFTLAWFRRDSEGYHVEFVGDRPFKVENTKSFWEMLKYGQSVLDAEIRLLENIQK